MDSLTQRFLAHILDLLLFIRRQTALFSNISFPSEHRGLQVVAADAHVESLSPAAHAAQDASHAFVKAAYEGLLGPQPAMGVTPEYQRALGGPAPVTDATTAPPGVDAASWDQISKMIGDGKNVQFTTAADNKANNNAQPDFILGADGILRPNTAKTTPPSADGKINIQVGDATTNQQAAKQAAQQLQVAAVHEKIAYWQRAHPGDPNIPDYLKGELSSAQTAGGPSLQPADQQAFNNLKFPDGNKDDVQISDPDAPANQPGQVPDSPGGNTAGPGGPGGPGGYESPGGNPGSPGGNTGGYRPGSDYHGLDNPGQGPQEGYTRGDFDPDAGPDTRPMPQAVAGDMSILLDPDKGPSCTVEQIQKFLEDHGSPAAKEIDPSNGKSFAQNLYDACTERHLDPGAAVGFFLQESTLGEHGLATHTHSVGNIRGANQETGASYHGFRAYETWSAGARDWAKLIDEKYVHGRNATTLSQILSVYAPASDGNNVHGYVGTVKGVVTAFRQEKDQNTAVASDTTTAPKSTVA